jgi:hypothetical protein
VPVLGERTPLNGRYVENGVTGILRHRGDEAQWASEIAAALAHQDRADALHTAARQSAARWPLDAGADGWLQVADAARDRTRWAT